MKIIRDEFTHQDLTRQQRYQLRHERDGLCRLCPDLVEPGHKFCADHLKKQRIWCNPVAKASPAPKTNSVPATIDPRDLI